MTSAARNHMGNRFGTTANLQNRHMEQNDLTVGKRAGELVLRKAVPSDAPLIAKTIMMGMGYDLGSGEAPEGRCELGEVGRVLDAIAGVAAMDDTIYSYRNACIASLGGASAGCLVSYDGGEYGEKSRRTFALISRSLGVEELRPGTETKAGEYYLDSLAVLPEFRGRSISGILIGNALEVAQGLGFDLASLIVDKAKPHLHRLYSRLGFRFDGEVDFFGEPYYRMVQDL